ncbi:MAG: hypothetical protein LBQ66_04675 [Planctomycetaceae bacterium]|jgi:hypothetical protein|nr:hypothetical protein [Planctomycetaceae bacterium]
MILLIYSPESRDAMHCVSTLARGIALVIPHKSFAASRQLSATPTGDDLEYQHVFRPTVFVLLRSPKTQPSSGRLPTLRSPTRLGVQFKLVRFYYAQRRAGRPRSSPSPLRGNCRLRRRVMIWNINTFSAPSRRGQAPVANIMRIHL